MCEWVPACLPAEPQTFIFTCDAAEELIAVNSCAGCKVGAVVALFYITNTLFLLIPICFQGTPEYTKKKRGFELLQMKRASWNRSSSKINKLIIIVICCDVWLKDLDFFILEIFKMSSKTNGGSTCWYFVYIYSVLSRSFCLINCIGGTRRKTRKLHTFLQLPCVFGKWFVFDSASQEMSMCALWAAGELGGPFNKPDLILTVVDGQKPKSVRVATVPDLS